MSPEEAYVKSIECGIKRINNLIADAVDHGLVKVRIKDANCTNKQVIEHFKKLGYKFNEYNGIILWEHAKPAFNQ